MPLISSWRKYIIIGVVGVAAIGGIYVATTKSSREILSPGGNEVPSAAPKIEDMVTWKDEAGFSFQYPKGLATNKHEEDNQNYAHVELTSPDHKGSVIVWVQDPFLLGLLGWIIARMRGAQFHIQVHTDVFHSGFLSHTPANRPLVLLARFILGRADSIRVVS